MLTELVVAAEDAPQRKEVEIGVFDIDGFCKWASIGRTRCYSEVKKGRLRLRKLGKRSLILLEDAQAWRASLQVAA